MFCFVFVQPMRFYVASVYHSPAFVKIYPHVTKLVEVSIDVSKFIINTHISQFASVPSLFFCRRVDSRGTRHESGDKFKLGSRTEIVTFYTHVLRRTTSILSGLQEV